MRIDDTSINNNINNTETTKEIPHITSVTNNASENTEKLREIDVSVVAQPSIRNSKKVAKQQKLNEILDIADKNNINKTTNSSLSNKNITLPSSLTRSTTQEGSERREKHLDMMKGNSPYDITGDLNNNFAKITFGQLLDICPKLRSQLNKALKLKNLACVKGSFEDIVLSSISRNDIATTKCLINGVMGSAFLDTCASINIVTKKFLNKLGGIKPFGYTSNNLIQITTKARISTELYLLTVKLGSLTVQDIFQVIDQDQDLFDILIGYSMLKDNSLFINPIDNYLCQMKEDETWTRVLPLSHSVEEASENLEKEDNKNRHEILNDNVETITQDPIAFCFINKIETRNPLNLNNNVMERIAEPPDGDSIIQSADLSDDESINQSDDSPDNESIPQSTDSPNGESIDLNIKIIDEEAHENHDNPKIVKSDSELENTDKKKIIADILKLVPKPIKERFKRLLYNNIDILALRIEELDGSKLLPHNIQLAKGTSPIKQKAYRLSKVQSDALKKELTKLLQNKLIEASCSPWSSPVILIPKKNKTWRLCIDYRKLNNVTIKDAYSLPLIDEILFSMGRRVKVFTTIDLFSGFHQIPMNKKDIPKTSFTTPYGNYQFKVMPFGLCNAPGTFQREMNRIFFPLIGKCLFVYIDDLVIFSETYEAHLQDLNKVFNIIKENCLKINLEKCHFFKQEVELLGHTVSTKGISPIANKIKVISEWLPPTSITQLQSFLGAVGYYRKFIFNFAAIGKPLFALLKKGVKFDWTEKEEECFHELKKRLISAPILIMPDFSQPFIIRTDASLDGIGGVLLQKRDKKEMPIHFISRTLKPQELNYGITDLEGTAAAYCVKKFKSYISGSPYETQLYTDHKPLVSLINNKETQNARQTRWVLLLSMLRVKVNYEPGKRNVIADALSRLKTKKEEIIATVLPDTSTLTPDYILNSFKDKFVIIKGEEFYQDNGTFRKVIKDEKEKLQLILDAHNVGHEGIFKTYNRLKRDYYWVNMALDVKYIVTTCKRCQLFKPQTFNSLTEDIPTEPALPFVRVGLDIIGPLPNTKLGNQYLLVLVDYFTKWVEAEPTATIESSDVMRFLLKVFSRHGIPQILVTDNGPQFFSDKTKAFLDMYGVYVHYGAVYHPESNGMVENRNKEIGKYLRILCNKNVQEWDKVLPSALWALRTCKNETTKYSSFELLYGRRDLQPFELMINLEGKELGESQEEYLIRKFTKHHKWIQEAVENIQTANKIWEDRRKQIKRLKADYKPGDLVLIRFINRRKLDPYFIGPMKIVKKQFNTVTVCDPITNEVAERNVHLKNIVPYKLCEVTTSRDEV